MALSRSHSVPFPLQHIILLLVPNMAPRYGDLTPLLASALKSFCRGNSMASGKRGGARCGVIPPSPRPPPSRILRTQPANHSRLTPASSRSIRGKGIKMPALLVLRLCSRHQSMQVSPIPHISIRYTAIPPILPGRNMDPSKSYKISRNLPT